MKPSWVSELKCHGCPICSVFCTSGCDDSEDVDLFGKSSQCPANSTYNDTTSKCECNDGYTDPSGTGQECFPTNCGVNMSFDGSSCQCDEGFTRNDVFDESAGCSEDDSCKTCEVLMQEYSADCQAPNSLTDFDCTETNGCGTVNSSTCQVPQQTCEEIGSQSYSNCLAPNEHFFECSEDSEGNANVTRDDCIAPPDDDTPPDNNTTDPTLPGDDTPPDNNTTDPTLPGDDTLPDNNTTDPTLPGDDGDGDLGPGDDGDDNNGTEPVESIDDITPDWDKAGNLVNGIQESFANVSQKYEEMFSRIQDGFTFTPPPSGGDASFSTVALGKEIKIDFCEFLPSVSSIFYYIFYLSFMIVSLKLFYLGFKVR